MSRIVVPEMDEILGEKFRVLDDGFISPVDYLGSDHSVVQAARLTVKGSRPAQEDRALLRYLLRHHHTTPFEFCELVLHIRMPMDAWRQAIRHRTASVNEYSTRYSVAIDSCQRTGPTQWRKQSDNNRQGSSGYVSDSEGEILTEQEATFQETARKVYQSRLDMGVAREQARKDLPLSTYTEAYWKIDLHNLLHFLRLRMDSHAQEEIRAYATTIGCQIVAKWCPWTWEAFQDYRLKAIQLSRIEAEILRHLHGSDKGIEIALATAKIYGWLEKNVDGTLKRCREREEAEAKFAMLEIHAPWL